MKKIIYPSILSGLLSISSPTHGVENPVVLNIIQDNSDKVSDVITGYYDESYYDKKVKKYTSKEFSSIELNGLDNLNIFPNSVQTIGIDRLSNGLLGNMEKGGLSVVNPPFVDYLWFRDVYCAGTIKGFISSLKNDNDRSISEKRYINKEGIDAWELPDEFRMNGMYEPYLDFKSNFNLSEIGSRDVIDNKPDYYKKLLNLGEYLKISGKPGSLLFIYFNLSNYKNKVKEYNNYKLRKNPNSELSLNTHQAIYLGNSHMEFKAGDIKIVNSNIMYHSSKSIDSINFITDFVQQRGGYNSALSDSTKNKIIENLGYFHNLIEFYVNGNKVDLKNELSLPKESRIKINNEDEIKIYGPMFMDGFHDSLSNSKYISKNNHSRILFYFELLTIGTYTPSEFFIPTDSFNSSDDNFKISDRLDITNLYFLRKDESLSLRLKEAILRHKFELFDELKENAQELELSNIIQSLSNSSKKKIEYNLELIGYRDEKINNIISTLSEEEKKLFYNEYSNQIKGLQLMGYIQNEGKINPGSLNINSPIPYFNTENINFLFSDYINSRKNELLIDYGNNINDFGDNLYIFTFPGDNFGTLYTQIRQKLHYYTDKYPSFKNLDNLNLLKRNKLMDIIFDKYFDDKFTDITNGRISSMEKIIIPLGLINEVLLDILDEEYIDAPNLSDLDRDIILNISNSNEDYNLLSHILVQESYESGIPLRKYAKIIGRYFGKVSSYGDFQTRLNNLNDPYNSLLVFPKANDILNAISYLDKNEIKELIDRRAFRYKEELDIDLSRVEEIKNILEFNELFSDKQRLNAGKKIFLLLRDLFKFNDSNQINIVGKVVQSRLILDKINDHYYNLNGWLHRSGFSLDDIIYDEDLQTRYEKMILLINNMSEKNTLLGISENYILRILESLGDDTSSGYPSLDINFKGQIEYKKEIINRFDFYLSRLEIYSDKDEIVLEIINCIEEIMKTNYSATSIYNFFGSQKIKDFLSINGYDDNFLPTLEELEIPGFRHMFFSYSKTPLFMEPPGDFKAIEQNIKTTVFSIIGGIGGYIYLRRRKKKIKN